MNTEIRLFRRIRIYLAASLLLGIPPMAGAQAPRPGRGIPPRLKPDSTVTITLERTGCFGTCPAYIVSLSTTGTTKFHGRAFVAAMGDHEGSIDPSVVRQLAAQFLDAHFYALRNSYRARITDNPTYVLILDIDGERKWVEDYVGKMVGMPKVVTHLENAVDAAAHSNQWILRDGKPVLMPDGEPDAPQPVSGPPISQPQLPPALNLPPHTL